ncbi:hypothetical protein EC991_009878, partial [Linnemannia zychae]
EPICTVLPNTDYFFSVDWFTSVIKKYAFSLENKSFESVRVEYAGNSYDLTKGANTIAFDFWNATTFKPTKTNAAYTQNVGGVVLISVNPVKDATSPANNGAALAQIVETTKTTETQIIDQLQRIYTLTVQGLNGTYTPSQTAPIQGEIDQRLAEIDRLSEQTEVNGIRPLLRIKILFSRPAISKPLLSI